MALAALWAFVLVACRVTSPPGPPVADVVLPVFDPAAIADGRPPDLGPLPTLEVRDYGPEGVSDGDRIRVRFNQPVVDMRDAAGERSTVRLELRALDSADAAAGSGKIVAADSEWTHADTLELRPTKALPQATGFEVTLPAGLTNRDGSSLGQLRWRFETPRPTVELLGANEPVLANEPIYLMSDQPMTIAGLEQHLQVLSPARPGQAPKPMPLRVESIEYDDLPELWQYHVDRSDSEEGPWLWAVWPTRRWNRDVPAIVRIDDELRGTWGPRPMAEPFEDRVHVLDRFRVLRSECLNRRGTTCYPGPVAIELSTPLGYEDLEVTVSPKPDTLYVHNYEHPRDRPLGEDEYEDEAEDEDTAPYRGVIEVDGDFVPGRPYTITIAGSQVDKQGQRLGRRWRKRFVMRPSGPVSEQPGEASVWLWSGRGTFLRPESAQVGILSAHVEEARIRVVVLDDATRRRLLATRDLKTVPWPKKGETSVVLLARDNRGESGRAESVLDLSRFAKQGDAVLVQLEASVLTDAARNEEPVEPVRGLFQLSDIGAMVSMSPARGVIQVMRASTAEPWSGVRARLFPGTGADRKHRSMPASDAHGLLPTPGAEGLGEDAFVMLEAPDGADRVAVRLRDYQWAPWYEKSGYGARISRRYPRVRAREKDEPKRPAALRKGERGLVGVQVGRGIYLPGDTVHLAGWGSIATPYGNLATRRAPVGTTVVVELKSIDDEVVASRRVELDRHGRFSASMALPPRAKLGLYRAEARMFESTMDMVFTVADARIPTFEVEAKTTPAEVQRGTSTSLEVSTRYLSGGPAPMERMHWRMSCNDGSFSVPGYDWHWSFDSFLDASSVSAHGTVELADEPRAHARATLSTDALELGFHYVCRVSVAGQDPSLQQNGADGSFQVHPASAYVGLLAPEDAIEGEPSTVEVVAVDWEGQRVVQDGVEVVVRRVPEYDPREASKKRKPVEVARCSLDLAADGERGRCVLPKLKVGSYEVQADATIDGVPMRSDDSFEVEAKPEPEPEPEPESESTWASESTSDSSSSPVAKPPARPKYLTIKGPTRTVPADKPFDVQIEWKHSGAGVLTVGQNGLRESKPFVLEDGKAAVSVTPRSGRGPVFELSAVVPRPEDGRTLPSIRQAHYEANVEEDRSLDVKVEIAETARPGERVPFTITVRDPEGAPVDARVAVWAVDEGLHQLRRPPVARLEWLFNPVLRRLEQRTQNYDQLLRPFTPWAFGGRGKRIPKVRQAKAQVKGALGDPEVREHFESVPLFEGNVGTGPDGVVELTLPLPDNLTRFEIAAMASAELPDSVGKASGPGRFGRGQATISVSTPLVVRAVLPRVLRPGDRARLAALVIPPEGSRGTLVVDAKLRGPKSAEQIRIVGSSEVERTIDGPTRVEFEVESLQAGTPRVLLAARFKPTEGKALSSAVERPLTVAVERTQVERVATYGRLDRDEPVEIPVLVPKDVRPDVGGLSLTMRGTAIGDLDEAVEYLEDYPYGCLEQTSSRLLPLVALAGLSDRFTGKQAQARQARWSEGLDHLLSMQRSDGAFNYWPGGVRRSIYAGAYATWVMQLAADAGQSVPEAALERALDSVERGLSRAVPKDGWKADHRRAEWAIMVHTLAQAGRGEAEGLSAVIDDLFDHRDQLPLFSRAQLLMTMHALDPSDARIVPLRRSISVLIEELPGSAHLVEGTDHGRSRYDDLFDSSARSHAMVLMAWLQIEPDSPLNDKLAAGLRLRRTGGRWRNTQENAYALLALSTYARHRESAPVDHRVHAWVGPRSLGSARQVGRSDDARMMKMSMGELLGPLASDRVAPVVLDREGTGAAYYRLGMEWAVQGDAPARSQGLTITRRIVREGEAVSSLEAGRRYLLEVVVETDARHRYLAAEVPLPAGIEAIDTQLGAGASARVGEAGWYGQWVSHQELHGDRVLLFADDLPPGRHIHRIPVLASTPGEYRMPAAVVEGMYAPEVRSRTTSLRVEVHKDR